ncbi:MAG: nuclear transport factor 2 family protein [Sphingobacteriaceae bacterium]|nr:nuclear transport factor 2 family protein [Sphingobacteriaceae bacterium]
MKSSNKILFFVAAFLFLSSGYFFSQNNGLQIVTQHMMAQERAWNEGNIDGFMKHYWKSDSLKFIGKSGITYGWQKTLDNYKKNYPNKAKMGKLVFQILSLEQLSDNSVYIIGSWNLEREEPAGGHFTLLWKKIQGEWVIVCDHTS